MCSQRLSTCCATGSEAAGSSPASQQIQWVRKSRFQYTHRCDFAYVDAELSIHSLEVQVIEIDSDEEGMIIERSRRLNLKPVQRGVGIKGAVNCIEIIEDSEDESTGDGCRFNVGSSKVEDISDEKPVLGRLGWDPLMLVDSVLQTSSRTSKQTTIPSPCYYRLTPSWLHDLLPTHMVPAKIYLKKPSVDDVEPLCICSWRE